MSNMDPLYELMKDSAEDMTEAAVKMKGMMTADATTDVTIEGYGPKPSFSKQIKSLFAGKSEGVLRLYPTLAAAQADIANTPEGSTTYYRSPDDSALAIEVMNVSGTLEATGREMPSQQSIDQKIEFDDFQVLSKLKDDAGNECFHVDAFGQMFFVKVGSKSLQDTLSSIAETVSRDKSANLHDFPDLNHQRVAFLDDTGNLYIPGLGNFSVQDKIRDLDALVGKDRNKNISRNYDQDGQLINLQDEDGKLYLPGLGSKSVQDSIKDIRAHYDHDRAPHIKKLTDAEDNILSLTDEDGKLYLPGLGSKSVQEPIKDMRD